MLFIAPEERGKGLGRQLIKYGIENYAVNEVCVNEQNPQAVGFYEHMGFRVYKRTDFDEQGNPYPILCMELSNSIFIKYSKPDFINTFCFAHLKKCIHKLFFRCSSPADLSSPQYLKYGQHLVLSNTANTFSPPINTR